jgi:hypothetical protein
MRLPGLILLGLMMLAGHLGQARAATFSATELSYDNALLNQFNLIDLGNFSTSNETEGRILVGGNATVSGSTNVCFNGGCNGNTTFGASSGISAGKTTVSASNPGYGALTVFGNISGSYSVMNKGDIDIRGTANGTYNLNSNGAFNVGGAVTSGTTVQAPTAVKTSQSSFAGTIQNANGVNAQTNVALATVFPFGSTVATNFGNPLNNLSAGLAALPGTPGVSVQNLPANQMNTPLIAGTDYTANGKSYGVVTTTLANLVAEGQNFGGVENGSSDAATIVVVTGNVAGAVLPTLNYADSKVLYDFVDATSLTASGGFSASILAPLATLTQSGVINGSVVVAAMTQGAELHQGNAFTGDLSGLTSVVYTQRVPEPASFAVLGSGLATLAVGRRRARSRR